VGARNQYSTLELGSGTCSISQVSKKLKVPNAKETLYQHGKKQTPTALPCLYEQGFEGFVIGILVLIK